MSSKKRNRRNFPLVPLPVKIFFFSVIPLFLAGILFLLYQRGHRAEEPETSQTYQMLSIEEDFLTPNKYSRPQTKLKKVNNIVNHYTANPGSDAEANRNYFESLKDSHITYASSHFIVGLDGEIVQCIPLTEISYASNDRNKDTISIECCHPDKTGEFTSKTYQSLLRLCVYLCQTYGLSSSDLIRHYDVTGKLCPKYYVNHPKKWEELKKDVKALLDDY